MNSTKADIFTTFKDNDRKTLGIQQEDINVGHTLGKYVFDDIEDDNDVNQIFKKLILARKAIKSGIISKVFIRTGFQIEDKYELIDDGNQNKLKLRKNYDNNEIVDFIIQNNEIKSVDHSISINKVISIYYSLPSDYIDYSPSVYKPYIFYKKEFITNSTKSAEQIAGSNKSKDKETYVITDEIFSFF